MNIIEIINSRRNIKSFKSDPINMEQISKWLQAGTMAPNHKMTEPWEVFIIGPETRAKLNHKSDFFNAPAVLAVLSKHGSTEVETVENALATACFVQNFNLAAWAEGVGTFWSSMGNAQKNRDIMGVPAGYDVIGVFGVGYPEEINNPKERTPIQEKIKHLS
ncbi:nitroreductase family protein [Metabacillus sediminilitoris]|uniref:Nitroreductase n=1 Tax=Metabacillus sediminilitoris TaxID=2567941 RepID=A0A4V3WFT0_9BACI|nr:nitroreductase family protein [Metabacillus sediminilitoris]QGQ48110.1 nitroreductase [Metabacillus sediminilitoris]THF81527.1 nitroreductase [Metabacillus sediminilitoris]